MKEAALLLHNVRSSHNVGSVFRTADAAGITRVYLSGYTPQPMDRFGRAQKDIAKTALGAERYLPWEHTKDPGPLMRRLKQHGWTLVGVEQDKRAQDFRSFRAHDKTLFIFGNEVRGLSASMRDTCDILLEIPMRGKKESLNVAVSAGIALFSALQ